MPCTLQVEADLAAALCWELHAFQAKQAELAMAEGKPTEGGARPPLKIGVITPYKKQVQVLRATFSRLLGDAASEVCWQWLRIYDSA